jgi:hypothetical protein
MRRLRGVSGFAWDPCLLGMNVDGFAGVFVGVVESRAKQTAGVVTATRTKLLLTCTLVLFYHLES